MLGVSEERAGIWLYDYQVRLKESSKKKVLHKICDTFTEFLELSLKAPILRKNFGLYRFNKYYDKKKTSFDDDLPF